jgi:hypothetical protein
MESKPIYETKKEKVEADSIVKIKLFLKKSWNVLLIVVGYIFAFYLGNFYQKYRSDLSQRNLKFPETKTRNEVSISVNDRGELVFMDRIKNEITIYDDTIGFIVYDFYSYRLTKK